MFESSVVRVQARAADRRLGLLTLSVGAHVAIIAGVVAAGLTSVRLPERAPNQWTIPVVPAPPPALGTPDARPRPTQAQPQKPQAQRVPVPQVVTAPNTIPRTVESVPASSAPASDTATTGGGPEGTPGVPTGSIEGVDVDGPPSTSAALAMPTTPVRAGIGDVKSPVVVRRVQPLYPPAAMRIHMNGFVIVECIIDRTVVVRDAKVIQSSSKLFEQSALDAVQQ